MSRLSLIIQREYMQMVAKKSFLVTTILVPVLTILVCGVLPIMLSSVKSDTKKSVAVIDQSPDRTYSRLLQSTEEFVFIPMEEQEGKSFYDLYAESEIENLYALVVIPDTLAQNTQVSIYSGQAVGSSLSSVLGDAIEPALRSQRVASYGIESLEQIINDCDVRLDVRNIRWDDEGGETLSSAEISEMLGLFLALLTYMFVMMYGAMIMSGVVEEKTNRIVEVIISSVKPVELMLGKIIGVALVGFTQLLIWGVILGGIGMIVSAGFLFGGGVDPMAVDPIALGVDPGALGMDPAALGEAMQGEVTGNSKISEIVQMIMGINFAQISICFILYFIGGYLLYASIFAAFGSAVDQQQDTSQFMTPVMLIMIFALYVGMFSIQNPDGPLAWWCSIIPFTSPIVMMVRLPFDVPFYELLLSFVLLYATAFFVLWLSARIYRTGILMYGKKFTFKEIIKWIKA